MPGLCRYYAVDRHSVLASARVEVKLDSELLSHHKCVIEKVEKASDELIMLG